MHVLLVNNPLVLRHSKSGTRLAQICLFIYIIYILQTQEVIFTGSEIASVEMRKKLPSINETELNIV